MIGYSIALICVTPQPTDNPDDSDRVLIIHPWDFDMDFFFGVCVFVFWCVFFWGGGAYSDAIPVK